MKIVHYCQHVLGIGHFIRSLEICKALKGHKVLLVTGGPPIDTPLPPHIREVRLPGLMMDSNFKRLFPTEKGGSIEQVKQKRQKLVFDLFNKEAPDIFIVELYPFGRKAFRFELDPVLEGICNNELPACKVICSLRDVLVEREDSAKYEMRVISSLNRYFDAVLVHADPDLLKLDETFSRIGDISIPLVYTGFVTPKPSRNIRARLRRQLEIGTDEFLIVASAGGGHVGAPLLQAVVNALAYIDKGKTVHLYVFAGPFMDEAEFDRLHALAGKGVQVFRFKPDFLSYLAAADLSVSMAGYNTCMNILAANVPALVWPFSQNREQRFRAERLAGTGMMQVLDDKDLCPDRLAAIMDQALSQRSRQAGRIDLDGARKTAEWLENWMQSSQRL